MRVATGLHETSSRCTDGGSALEGERKELRASFEEKVGTSERERKGGE